MGDLVDAVMAAPESCVHAGALRVLTGLAMCCDGAALKGPGYCTCWEPVYAEPGATELTAPGPIATRPSVCEDCAYRGGSHERQGDDRYPFAGEIADLHLTYQHVFCHRDQRRVIAWRHPLGITVEADIEVYDPPMATVDGVEVPVLLDGSVGPLCAGFVNAKARHAASGPRNHRDEGGSCGWCGQPWPCPAARSNQP